MFQERIFKTFDGNMNKTANIFQIMFKMCGKDFNKILLQEITVKFSFRIIVI